MSCYSKTLCFKTAEYNRELIERSAAELNRPLKITVLITKLPKLTSSID